MTMPSALCRTILIAFLYNGLANIAAAEGLVEGIVGDILAQGQTTATREQAAYDEALLSMGRSDGTFVELSDERWAGNLTVLPPGIAKMTDLVMIDLRRSQVLSIWLD